MRDGRLQPVVLLFGEGNADGLAFDLAGPLIMGATGPGAEVLGVAFADPVGSGEAFSQGGITAAALGGGDGFGHAKEDSVGVNRAVCIPLYARHRTHFLDSALCRLAVPTPASRAPD